MTDAELAYVAGFFDGEGCISMHLRSNGLHTLTLMICNTHGESLESIVTLFGVGKVYRREPNKPHHLPLYTIQIHGGAAKKVLEAILPYLRIKHIQAKLAVTFQEFAESNHTKPVPLWEREIREILGNYSIALNHVEGHGTKKEVPSGNRSSGQ